jgi:hypothetical protein
MIFLILTFLRIYEYSMEVDYKESYSTGNEKLQYLTENFGGIIFLM